MNIQENITKTTDLNSNDSLSGFMGHAAQQSHFAYQVFYDFIKEVKPKRILEIGTALGGFTEFLFIIKNELGLDTEILSYDISERPWYSDMIKKGINVKVENIFSEDWLSVKSEVIDYIKNDGLTIVLCDGGWKVGEFNLLSNYIKTGDFILAHDYAENNKIFEEKIKDKIWNWHEISNDDIQEASIKNNLELYKKDTFENAVWTCRIKK